MPQMSSLILPPSHFVCPLFHFEMFQNIVLFLKIKVINLLMFLWGNFLHKLFVRFGESSLHGFVLQTTWKDTNVPVR